MNILIHTLTFLLALTPTATLVSASYSSDDKTHPLLPCTVRSPQTGAFFDLSPLHIVRPHDPDASTARYVRERSWNATGWDIGYNFTLNFCGSVVEDLDALGGVEGVDRAAWGDVAAYYVQDANVYSLGLQNSFPVMRGRKMVLNYTNGSPCPDPLSDAHDTAIATDVDVPTRRKTTLVSLLCERDPLMPLLTLSFVGSPDECTYVFEARSSAACPGIERARQTLGPAGVFGVLAAVALLVYVVGGCVYSRTVLHQRGWRQLPNYALWAGIFAFFRDLLIVSLSPCARLCGSSRQGGAGYRRVRPNGWSGRDSEAENRLIDEFNEEWED